MKNVMNNRYRQYRQLILYVFFGICTTAINTAAYGVLYEALCLSNVLSTVLAWLLAVIFAYVTNKLYVFRSRNKNITDNAKEFVSFFTCRLLTGFLDVFIMYGAVDCQNGNSLIWKLISNIIVTVINYIVSRLLIFRK